MENNDDVNVDVIDTTITTTTTTTTTTTATPMTRPISSFLSSLPLPPAAPANFLSDPSFSFFSTALTPLMNDFNFRPQPPPPPYDAIEQQRAPINDPAAGRVPRPNSLSIVPTPASMYNSASPMFMMLPPSIGFATAAPIGSLLPTGFDLYHVVTLPVRGRSFGHFGVEFVCNDATIFPVVVSKCCGEVVKAYSLVDWRLEEDAARANGQTAFRNLLKTIRGKPYIVRLNLHHFNI